MRLKRFGRQRDDVSGLTPGQERFCHEYAVDLSPTNAARRAGYSEKSAHKSGKQMLENPNVMRRIQELQAERNQKTRVTAEWVIEKLSEIAGADVRHAHDPEGKLMPVHQMPEHVSRALQSVETYKDFTEGVEVGETQKIRMHDKMKALELLGKHFKLYTDKVELSGTLGLAERLERARKKKG